MYKILDDDVKLRIGSKWHTTTVVLTNVRGGLQVQWVDADGNILKSLAYSRSPYTRKKGDGFDADVATLRANGPNFTDFYMQMRGLGLEETRVIEGDNDGSQHQNQSKTD